MNTLDWALLKEAFLNTPVEQPPHRLVVAPCRRWFGLDAPTAPITCGIIENPRTNLG